jgi:hypothetical protein
MAEKAIMIYELDVGKDFVKEKISNDNLDHKEREKIRSIQVLDDYLNVLGSQVFIRNGTICQTYAGDVSRTVGTNVAHKHVCLSESQKGGSV